MTKDELATEISGKTGIEKVKVMKIIESMMETVKLNMSQGEAIYLRKFGTFYVKKRAMKTARNISKNTVVVVPECLIPAFKPSKEFAASVKAKNE